MSDVTDENNAAAVNESELQSEVHPAPSVALERVRENMAQLSLADLQTILSETKLLVHLRECESRLQNGFDGIKYPKLRIIDFNEGNSDNWEHVINGEATAVFTPLTQQTSQSVSSIAPASATAAVSPSEEAFTLSYKHERPEGDAIFRCAHSWELDGNSVAFSWKLRGFRHEYDKYSKMTVDGLRDWLRRLGVLPKASEKETAEDIQQDEVVTLKFLQSLFYVFEPTNRACYGSGCSIGGDEPSQMALGEQWRSEQFPQSSATLDESFYFSFSPSMQSARRWIANPQRTSQQ